MHVQSFDTFEEMQASMAAAEEAANARILPQQAALRDDDTDTRYWVRPCEEGFLIFGVAPTYEALCEEEAKYSDLDTEEGQAEYEYSCQSLKPRRARGYLTGVAFSVVEPTGEQGDTHVSQVCPISEQAFNEGKAAGWRMVAPDALLALTGDLDALTKAGKITPTLIDEWTEFRRSIPREA